MVPPWPTQKAFLTQHAGDPILSEALSERLIPASPDLWSESFTRFRTGLPVCNHIFKGLKCYKKLKHIHHFDERMSSALKARPIGMEPGHPTDPLFEAST